VNCELCSKSVRLWSYLVDERVRLIVFAGIVKHEHKVTDHVFNTIILASGHSLMDALHVDRPLDHLIVVWVFLHPKTQSLSV